VRLPPLPRERWGDGAREAIEAGFGPKVADRFLSDAPDAPAVPNVLGTLMHHPALAGPWLAFNRVLLFAPSLSARQRELMVLRVAARTGSAYEWAQHARMAPQCDITADEVEQVAAGTGAWSPAEADLLAATDQLLDDHRIDDATWARLAAHFDERQLVELVFVVGAYTCLAMAFNSFGIELDPDLR
jgi:alkylhydroperoxidase family enzyme